MTETYSKCIALMLLFILPLCVYAQVVNKVVAVVNDEVITQQDIDQLLAVLYAQHVQAYTGDELLQKMEELKKNILRQMIEDKLILSRAKELEIKVIDVEIDDKLRFIKSGFPSEEEFYDTLQAQGITVSNLKARYRDQISMQKIINLEVASRVTVFPSDVTDYYEKHRRSFKKDEKYKVRHILIKAEDDVGFELAKVEIEEVYNKLREGYDFRQLAKEYSQGPNKERGGDMGYISQGEMLEELDEAIFSLRPEEFSGPLKSKIGYHIVKVEDITHSGYFSLEDVKEGIEKLIFKQKLKDRLAEWLGELRRDAYISVK